VTNVHQSIIGPDIVGLAWGTGLFEGRDPHRVYSNRNNTTHIINWAFVCIGRHNQENNAILHEMSTIEKERKKGI